MKYWNKSKAKRGHWIKFRSTVPFNAAKIWCQQHSSKGRFYSGRYTHMWEFENSEDAVTFKLVWDKSLK